MHYSQRVTRAVWLLVFACSSQSTAAPGRVEIVDAPATGDLATWVGAEVVRGTRDPVPVLVYVGATWCAPCREFHAAALAGRLDVALGPLRLLELDLDRDGPYLTGAGYTSQLVPLFAPGADGKATGTQIEGVRQGGNYVEQLTPRVRALVDGR